MKGRRAAHSPPQHQERIAEVWGFVHFAQIDLRHRRASELAQGARARRDHFFLLLCIERRVVAKVHAGSALAVRERRPEGCDVGKRSLADQATHRCIGERHAVALSQVAEGVLQAAHPIGRPVRLRHNDLPLALNSVAKLYLQVTSGAVVERQGWQIQSVTVNASP